MQSLSLVRSGYGRLNISRHRIKIPYALTPTMFPSPPSPFSLFSTFPQRPYSGCKRPTFRRRFFTDGHCPPPLSAAVLLSRLDFRFLTPHRGSLSNSRVFVILSSTLNLSVGHYFRSNPQCDPGFHWHHCFPLLCSLHCYLPPSSFACPSRPPQLFHS